MSSTGLVKGRGWYSRAFAFCDPDIDCDVLCQPSLAGELFDAPLILCVVVIKARRLQKCKLPGNIIAAFFLSENRVLVRSRQQFYRMCQKAYHQEFSIIKDGPMMREEPMQFWRWDFDFGIAFGLWFLRRVAINKTIDLFCIFCSTDCRVSDYELVARIHKYDGRLGSHDAFIHGIVDAVVSSGWYGGR